MESGYLLSLDRDDARELFGYKTDEEVASFCQSKLQGDEDVVCKLGQQWQDFETSLSDYAATLEDERAAAILSQLLAGGRSLYQGSDKVVRLVRPDVAALAADLLQGFQQSLPADSGSGALATQVQSLFSQSSQTRKAVVFFVN